MLRPLGALLGVLALALSSASVSARARATDTGKTRDQPVTAFVHARILPMSSAERAGQPGAGIAEEIPDGILVVRGSRIEAVGPADRVKVPESATVVDLSGRIVMPGLVDTHSHVGGGWGADGSAPIQPDVRVEDSIDCRNTGFRRALAGGITTLNVMSGSGHLMSGQTAYLKNRRASAIEEMRFLDEDGRPLGGMKMANGTNSQRPAPFPGTRSKSAALVREQFLKARARQAKLQRPKRGEEPEPDPALDALIEVLEGRRIVHHHTHRHDDIITVLRLKEEFGFRVVLHHVSEAWKVPREIARADAPCSIIVIDSPGGKIEARDLSFETGRILEEAGVLVSFHTDDWITDSRLFLRSAALAVRAGMSRTGALRALTINPARQLDLHERVGSLEPGKDADFIVLSGDPLSTFTRIEQTWVEGIKLFDLANDDDRLWAEGGWGAGERRAVHACCFADEEIDR